MREWYNILISDEKGHYSTYSRYNVARRTVLEIIQSLPDEHQIRELEHTTRRHVGGWDHEPTDKNTAIKWVQSDD